MLSLYYVGRFVSRQKNINSLLELANLLDLENIDYRFDIFSEIDVESAEFQLFKSNPKFHFNGFLTNWSDLISKDAIMIFVSKYEGCPLSILEANKSNLRKVLVLRIPGIENYVSENCLAHSITDMADKLIAGQDLANRNDLSAYFDSSRFSAEVKSFFETI